MLPWMFLLLAGTVTGQEVSCMCSAQFERVNTLLRRYRRAVILENEPPPEGLVYANTRMCSALIEQFTPMRDEIVDCPQGLAASTSVCLSMVTHDLWPDCVMNKENVTSLLFSIGGLATKMWDTYCDSSANALDNQISFPFIHPRELDWNYQRIMHPVTHPFYMDKLPAIRKYVFWRNPTVSRDRIETIDNACWLANQHLFDLCCKNDNLLQAEHCWNGNNFTFENCCLTTESEALLHKYKLTEIEKTNINDFLYKNYSTKYTYDCMDYDHSCLSGYCSVKKFEEVADRTKVKAILQIGTCFGNALAFLSDFFPNALVVGLDTFPERFFYGSSKVLREKGMSNRVEVYFGDVLEEGFGDYLIDEFGLEFFDIIIDGQSHDITYQGASTNQSVKLFEEMFVKVLAPGGYYHIEDSSDMGLTENKLSYYKNDILDAVHFADNKLGRHTHFAGYSLDMYVDVATDSLLEMWVDNIDFRRNFLSIRKRDGFT